MNVQKLTRRLYNVGKYMIKIPLRYYIIDDILTRYKNSQFSEYILFKDFEHDDRFYEGNNATSSIHN